jgi:hypothetical protein
MIPSLVKAKLSEKYGQDFTLPDFIDLLLPAKQAFNGLEHHLQTDFFKWLSQFVLDNPYLYLAHAIPNGGSRNIKEAAGLKAEGVKAGIPDIFLPIPIKNYNGLYIEFKAKGNKPSEDQRIMMLMLNDMGYKVICVNSLDIAKEQFKNYIYG